MLSRLSKRFNLVWVEPGLYWREYLEHPLKALRPFRSAPDVAVLHQSCLTPRVYRLSSLSAAIQRRRLLQARVMLRRAGARRIVLYLWRPEWAYALDQLPHDLSCYHIDDEYSFSATERGVDPAEAEIVRRVDRVFCVSRALAEKKGGGARDVVLIPNGVDYAAYSSPRPEPADLAVVPHPRVGYVGVVKKQLDLALMLSLARRQPRLSFVFVGPIGEIGDQGSVLDALRALQNVHFLGSKSVDDLPAYVQHLDANLLCYRIDGYTKYIYPLKLHEYLAAGRPVVSSDLEAVREFAGIVQIAHTPEDWEQILATVDRHAMNDRAGAVARQAVAARYDWDSLVGTIAETIEVALRAKQSRAATP